MRTSTTTRPELIDIAVRTLVADPSASLAKVATAAGISRTTLHKHYATRDDLVVAVGIRSLTLVLDAIDAAQGGEGRQQLTDLAAAMVPLGAHLSLLWRTPLFDEVDEMNDRFQEIDRHIVTTMESLQASKVIRSDRPLYWCVQALYAYVYVAWEGVEAGKIARLDAPELVVDSLLGGLGQVR